MRPSHISCCSSVTRTTDSNSAVSGKSSSIFSEFWTLSSLSTPIHDRSHSYAYVEPLSIGPRKQAGADLERSTNFYIFQIFPSFFNDSHDSPPTQLPRNFSPTSTHTERFSAINRIPYTLFAISRFSFDHEFSSFLPSRPHLVLLYDDLPLSPFFCLPSFPLATKLSSAKRILQLFLLPLISCSCSLPSILAAMEPSYRRGAVFRASTGLEHDRTEIISHLCLLLLRGSSVPPRLAELPQLALLSLSLSISVRLRE